MSFTRPAQPPSSPQLDPGQVITVWGPAGLPGRTTLAIAIAAEIAAAGYSVALGDVDTPQRVGPSALSMLDEAPGFVAACASPAQTASPWPSSSATMMAARGVCRLPVQS